MTTIQGKVRCRSNNCLHPLKYVWKPGGHKKKDELSSSKEAQIKMQEELSARDKISIKSWTKAFFFFFFYLDESDKNFDI